MERLLVHAAGAVGANHWGTEGDRLYQDLLDHEFPADTAASLVSAVNCRNRSGAMRDRDAVASELAGQMAALPFGRAALGLGRAHAFVGPPGGGKTTMLVKLAVLLGMEDRAPVMLVSLDSRRIGGADQLKTFAQILGVPAVSIDHRAGLERLMETEGRRHILFLDTPGFSEEDLAEQAWLPAALRASEQLVTHLVLPAYARARECARMVRRYELFRPTSLMLTHVDESESLGAVIGEVLRSGLPVSYCGTGQSIPEDIRAAEPEWLAQQALFAMEDPVAGRSGEATWAVA
jgi:flagellar biosynthesis protein FlhF